MIRRAHDTKEYRPRATSAQIYLNTPLPPSYKCKQENKEGNRFWACKQSAGGASRDWSRWQQRIKYLPTSILLYRSSSPPPTRVCYPIYKYPTSPRVDAFLNLACSFLLLTKLPLVTIPSTHLATPYPWFWNSVHKQLPPSIIFFVRYIYISA